MNTDYTGKKITVLGMGESGEAAALLAADAGATVTALDSGAADALGQKTAKLRERGVEAIHGPAAERHAGACDLGILSPGIDPATPLVRHFAARGIELIGELEFAWTLCRCPVIAITGTNGKTTTTQLVAAILESCGVKTVAAGNISPAFSTVMRQGAELDVVTLEVSSFQLEQIRTFRPRISAWLNFAPDHLDRYNSMEEYRAAKLRIFENQTGGDVAIVKSGENLPPIQPRLVTFNAFTAGADFSFHAGSIFHKGEPVLALADAQLRGLHNAENIMAALGVGIEWGLEIGRMLPAVRAFKAGAHRCEHIATVDGVDYVNDSKATNLDSLEKALHGESRDVVLIAGGKDKGFEFDSITTLVAAKVNRVILIGEMADRILRCWGGHVACEKAASLRAAVELARRSAEPGNVVLFSPGTSSFDMFKNYADRGNQFRAIVQSFITP